MSEINQEVSVTELQLGDIIRCFEGPFGTGIVQSIDDVCVKIFRPYGRSDDFQHTGGVICYTGIEHYALFKESKAAVYLYRRNPPK